jgi:hypothetical protein
MAMTMKNGVFCNVTPCGSSKNRLETLWTKRTELLCTLPFVLRCWDRNTIPQFLQFRHIISDAAHFVFLRSLRRLLVTAKSYLVRRFLSP